MQKVIIALNDDAGVWQWSVGLVGKWGDWIESFPTKAEAIDYCNLNEYKINHISEWGNDHIVGVF